MIFCKVQGSKPLLLSRMEPLGHTASAFEMWTWYVRGDKILCKIMISNLILYPQHPACLPPLSEEPFLGAWTWGDRGARIWPRRSSLGQPSPPHTRRLCERREITEGDILCTHVGPELGNLHSLVIYQLVLGQENRRLAFKESITLKFLSNGFTLVKVLLMW